MLFDSAKLKHSYTKLWNLVTKKKEEEKIPPLESVPQTARRRKSETMDGLPVDMQMVRKALETEDSKSSSTVKETEKSQQKEESPAENQITEQKNDNPQ